MIPVTARPPSSPTGHRRRLRQRFTQAGLAGFQDYEILELLLTFSVPRKDTKAAAKDLLKRHKGLAKVLDADESELLQTAGIGPRSALLLALVKQACAAYLRSRLHRRDIVESPQAAIDYCRMALAGKTHEVILALFVDTRNRLIADKILFEGTLDQSAVYPRRILEEALSLHASGFLLVHNHPSGNPSPSPEDGRLTQSLVEAAQTLDIRFLDHLIVGRGGYHSFLEAGFFGKK
ncbi:MAG: DNA repair protein RadC [Elusimicrobia bacterium]|nr:DNA repair protein RadC [Elusimicrobiota bacterium]